jgi:hypothetical protein
MGERHTSPCLPIPVGKQLRMIDATLEPPPLERPDAPARPGPEYVLPANPLTDVDDEGIAAFVDASIRRRHATDVLEPADGGKLVAVSTEAHRRDPIATLLGIVPLARPEVYAAPALVQTELAARIEIGVLDTRGDRLLAWCVAGTLAATITTVAALMLL